MSNRSDMIDLSKWTPKGRQAIRRWYRVERRTLGVSREAARHYCKALVHGAEMGGFWTGRP